MLKRVLEADHTKTLGAAVRLEHYDSNEAPMLSPSQTTVRVEGPMKFSVDPQIAIAIHKCSTKLTAFLESLSASSEVQLNHIVVTPSPQSCSDWKEKCEDFFEKNFSTCKIVVPFEIDTEMSKKFKEHKQGHAFVCESESSTNDSTTYLLAGEVDILQTLQKYNDEIKRDIEEELEISNEHHDFLEHFGRLEHFKSQYPSVTTSIVSHNHGLNFLMSLKGPRLYVKQLKKNLEKIVKDLKLIPVSGLDNKLIHHFSTTDGRKQIKEFIRLKECPMAVSFQCIPYQTDSTHDPGLTLSFVCESVNEQWAKSIPKELVKSAKYDELQVPDLLALKLDSISDYNELVLKLKTNQDVVIVLLDSKITVFGFSESVASSVEELNAYFEEKLSSSGPLVIPIKQLLCQALKKRPNHLLQILSKYNLSYTFSDDGTQLCVTSESSIGGDWKQRCAIDLGHYIEQFNEIQVTFSKDSTQEVHKYLSDWEQSSRIPCAFDCQSEIVEITGISTIVNPDFEAKLNDISESFTNISSEISLSPSAYAYISQVKFTSIKTDHPNLSFTLKENALMITGPSTSVSKLKNTFEQCYSIFSCCTATHEPLIAEFLLINDHGKEYLKTFMKHSSLHVATFFSEVSSTTHSLCFLCDQKDEERVKKLITDLNKAVVVGRVPLPKSLKKPKQSLKGTFIDYYKKIEKDCHVICGISDLSFEIYFTGLASNVQKAINLMDKFIKLECTTEKEIQLSNPEYKLIKNEQIWTETIQPFVVNLDTTGSQVKISLKGDEYEVSLAYTTLKETKDSIKTNSITVLAPGACKFFQDEITTATLIPSIQTTYKVVIETNLLEKDESEISVDDTVTTPSAREYCRTSPIKFFPSSDNCVTFKVYVSDITDFHADVIVNAANCGLKHVGGLAHAIVKQGGKEIQDDCNSHIQSRMHELNDGDTYFSRVIGKLPCKAIVHAVGPRWNKSRNDHTYENARLGKAVTNALKVSRGFHSIAFPAISSGIFEYPIEECAIVHVEAAIVFFSNKTACNLQEISFVVLHQEHAVAFHKALSRHFPGRVVDMEPSTCLYSLPGQPPVSRKGQSNSTTTPKTKAVVIPLPQLHQGDIFSSKVI